MKDSPAQGRKEGGILFSFRTLLMLCAAIFIGYWLRGHWGDRQEDDLERRGTIERGSATVITAVRGLSRLEGAEFHMERIIDLRQRQQFLDGLIEAEDALLLVAVGNVVAGVDLSDLVQADIQALPDGSAVSLKLPPAQIFSARLDSSRTYVHSRQTDLLATRQENLESKARARAEATLRQAALDGGILGDAEKNVRRTVTHLLLSLGFEKVRVSFRSTHDRTTED